MITSRPMLNAMLAAAALGAFAAPVVAQPYAAAPAVHHADTPTKPMTNPVTLPGATKTVPVVSKPLAALPQAAAPVAAAPGVSAPVTAAQTAAPR